ncbi:MAG: S41 family peptidase [Anaeromyxobacter sp.]
MRRLLLALTALVLGGILVVPRLTFDRAAWFADLDALEAHLARAYSNLEDAPRRGVDLAALDRRTRDALARAGTDGEARAAIAEFVGAFHDPHLQLRREKLSKRVSRWWRELRAGAAAQASTGPGLDPALDGAAACAAIGVTGPPGAALAPSLAALPGFAPLPAGDLAAGVAEVAGRKVGLVRLPSFDAAHYPGACAAAWELIRAGRSEPCAGACLEAFEGSGLEDAVLGALAARVRALRAAGATALVVDLTGNGGGAGWADAAARVVTARPLDCPGGAFVRHPHHVSRLAELERELAQATREPGLSPREASLLGEARERTAGALRAASEACDVSGVWRGAAPACSNRVVRPGRTCGLLGPLSKDGVRDPRAWGVLDALWQWSYEPGAWSGPLALLADARTASAAEAFAATLVDGGAAALLGERTMGAGCGYTNGGIPFRLPGAGIEVRAPDCSRLRRDGTNELDGIAPAYPGPAAAAIEAWLRAAGG